MSMLELIEGEIEYALSGLCHKDCQKCKYIRWVEDQ